MAFASPPLQRKENLTDSVEYEMWFWGGGTTSPTQQSRQAVGPVARDNSGRRLGVGVTYPSNRLTGQSPKVPSGLHPIFTIE